MNFGGDDDNLSPPYISSYSLDGPYNPSLASSASSSSASVWSDTSSQFSDDSSVISASVSSDLEVSSSYCCRDQSYQSAQINFERNVSSVAPGLDIVPPSVAPEHRQHPRRTSGCHGPSNRPSSPPALVRQGDRKVNFVDSLVDSSAQIIEAIWPLSSIRCRSDIGRKGVLPLRVFIQETLRRSRTSYSTLQVALYYLILIKPHVPKIDFTMEQTEESHSSRALQCGRRMFLSALILASKYLQDRNYSARAWSKISGLSVQEINQNEIAFLLAVNWHLHITTEVFQRWASIVLQYTPPASPSPGTPASREHKAQAAEWKSIILGLNPELDNLDSIPTLPSARSPYGGLRGTLAEPATKSFCGLAPPSPDRTPLAAYCMPHILEPYPAASLPLGKAAPAYGLLPTPKLTPNTIGYRTPAVNPSSYLPKPAMAYAQSLASKGQFTERWVTSSPHEFMSKCCSSLVNPASAVSSPESMISDSSSRSSRSSSISSASSLTSAPPSRLDVLARCRSAQQYDGLSLKPVTTFLPERLYEKSQTTSPDLFCQPAARDVWAPSASPTSAEYRNCTNSVEVDAAHTLQNLQNLSRILACRGSKRSRSRALDSSAVSQARTIMEDDVKGWSCTLVRPSLAPRTSSIPRSDDGRKRACCTIDARSNKSESLLPSHVMRWE